MHLGNCPYCGYNQSRNPDAPPRPGDDRVTCPECGAHLSLDKARQHLAVTHRWWHVEHGTRLRVRSLIATTLLTLLRPSKIWLDAPPALPPRPMRFLPVLGLSLSVVLIAALVALTMWSSFPDSPFSVTAALDRVPDLELWWLYPGAFLLFDATVVHLIVLGGLIGFYCSTPDGPASHKLLHTARAACYFAPVWACLAILVIAFHYLAWWDRSRSGFNDTFEGIRVIVQGLAYLRVAQFFLCAYIIRWWLVAVRAYERGPCPSHTAPNLHLGNCPLCGYNQTRNPDALPRPGDDRVNCPECGAHLPLDKARQRLAVTHRSWHIEHGTRLRVRSLIATTLLTLIHPSKIWLGAPAALPPRPSRFLPVPGLSLSVVLIIATIAIIWWSGFPDAPLSISAALDTVPDLELWWLYPGVFLLIDAAVVHLIVLVGLTGFYRSTPDGPTAHKLLHTARAACYFAPVWASLAIFVIAFHQLDRWKWLQIPANDMPQMLVGVMQFLVVLRVIPLFLCAYIIRWWLVAVRAYGRGPGSPFDEHTPSPSHTETTCPTHNLSQ